MLRRLAKPRQVSLPDGRTFLARYERVNRASLYPTNVRIKRTYRQKIGPRRQKKTRKKHQEGSGYIDSQNIIRGIDLGKRAANTEVGCMTVDDVVGLIPKGYKVLKTKLFRCKKTTTPFESHQPAQIISSEDYQPVQILSPEDYQKITEGLSNFDIEEIFNKVNNSDLLQNFVGVFPSDKMNKFLDFKKMMKGKKYPFLIANTDRSDKQGTHWWNILDINGKKIFFAIRFF